MYDFLRFQMKKKKKKTSLSCAIDFVVEGGRQNIIARAPNLSEAFPVPNLKTRNQTPPPPSPFHKITIGSINNLTEISNTWVGGGYSRARRPPFSRSTGAAAIPRSGPGAPNSRAGLITVPGPAHTVPIHRTRAFTNRI